MSKNNSKKKPNNGKGINEGYNILYPNIINNNQKFKSSKISDISGALIIEAEQEIKEMEEEHNEAKRLFFF